ncbi:MAG: hypothetical protein C4297_07560 [Gemmataceae bacterium]
MSASVQADQGGTRPLGLARSPAAGIVLSGVVQVVLSALLTWLSFGFNPGEAHRERPVLLVFGLWMAQFACYALGCLCVVRALKAGGGPKDSASPSRLMRPIVVCALLTRALQWPSQPIQEVDIYRYLWDGQVARAGISPYQYAPQTIRALFLDAPEATARPAEEDSNISGADRVVLARLLQHPSMRTILSRIEHGHVPTVYPPVAQALFLLAASLTPPHCSWYVQMLVLKLVLLGCDLATLWCMVALLALLRQPRVWCIVYAWNPLVLKEVANSGHVDSAAALAVCAAVLALLCQRVYLAWIGLMAALLTKMYPLVLAPFFWAATRPAGRHRWAAVGLAGIVSLALQAVFAPCAAPARMYTGLRVFATEWEMNDFLFRGLERSVSALLTSVEDETLFRLAPWWPRRMATAVREGEPVAPAFVISYALVAAVLLGTSYRLGRSATAADIPRRLVSLMVWAYLASPTVNPWYALWFIPFLPWSRYATWYALPAAVMQYYLRFWFFYHFPPGEDFWRGMSGPEFFDRWWIWIEHGPILIGWAWERCLQKASPPADER